ncbi:hypothetical protein Tco_0897815 [Tanacetum coccineum]
MRRVLGRTLGLGLGQGDKAWLDAVTGTGVKINIEHVEGKYNTLADSLSRLVNLCFAECTGEMKKLAAAALYSVEEVLQSPNASQKNMKTTCEEVMKISNHFLESLQKLSSHLKNQEHYTNVALDLELSAAKEAVKAMRNLQAIIHCKAQICFGKSTKDNHWSDQREDVRVQNKEARRILIELEALTQRLGCLKEAHEIWESIERLQQGESLNIQDVKTNLFWEFGKFTSHDGESIESYYSWFYKLVNEMIRNNLTVDTMQVNVQFLQQLQPEWSRFVTIVKQQHKPDEVSYHKFFDILKQYQNEVNEIHAERIAKNANPLALVAIAQPHQDPYYQTSKSHKSYAPTSKATLPSRSHATTRYKGKETAKPITPPSRSHATTRRQ